MKKILTAAIVFLGIVAFSLQAYAAPITFNYSSVFSGTAPEGTSPWITATFESISATKVKLTFSGANLVGSEFISEWDFNFNPAKTLADLAIAYVSGPVATFSTGINAFQADGDGKYDIGFNFPTGPPASRFDTGSTAIYEFDLAAGLVPEDFKFLSEPAGGSGPFYSAAHVQSIGEEGDSGWVSGDPSTGVIVPEPATMLLLGLGLLGIGIAVRKRF